MADLFGHRVRLWKDPTSGAIWVCLEDDETQWCWLSDLADIAYRHALRPPAIHDVYGRGQYSASRF